MSRPRSRSVMAPGPIVGELPPLPPPRRKRNGPSQGVKEKVLRRDRYRCAYCRGRADTVDHVVPRAKGGSNAQSNLVAACQECNMAKRDRLDVPRGRPVLPPDRGAAA